jgi:probable rRNA maturation factor
MTPAAPPVVVDVAVDAPAWTDRLPDAEECVRRAVTAAFDAAGLTARPDAELSVVLAEDASVQALNRDFRGKDTATNVLSFPGVSPEVTATAAHLGDIILAYGTVAREAEDEGKPFSHHLSHLVVHGVLHLFGFDHGTDAEAEEMEQHERVALLALGVPDPYAPDTVP